MELSILKLKKNEALLNSKVGTESGPVKYKYSIQLFSFAFEEICCAVYDKIICIIVKPLPYCNRQIELELYSDISLSHFISFCHKILSMFQMIY